MIDKGAGFLQGRSMASILPFIIALLVAFPALRLAANPPPAGAPAQTKVDPSLQPVQDVPGLPRVLLIGDSISMGYTLPVRELLKGRANVHRPPTNCSSTGHGLIYLKSWLGDAKWDVIHFNFGLHDAKLPPEGVRHAPPEMYEQNLRALVKQMQATGARLVFATTTPVPHGGILSPTRRFGSIDQYNEAARRVTAEMGVAVNDLNALIAPRVDSLQIPNDVHFTGEGSSVLAAQVAKAVTAALEEQSGQAGSGLLEALTSPVLFQGDENTGYRDPLLLRQGETFHLFFTLGERQPDAVYLSLAHSTSQDLRHWTPVRRLTKRDLQLNFVSPGSVIRQGDEWILCASTYPQPAGELYGNATARLYLMRSRDLENWSEPELIRVKGPGVPEEAMGRMIDAYLMRDRAEAGKWWCFFKQNGVSMSWSNDLCTWTFAGSAQAGENVCVLDHNGEYLMFHSPKNGVGVLQSRDLVNWAPAGPLITLGQKDWPWAQGRLTAGYVADLRSVAGIGKYVMVFHGTGPEPEPVKFLTHGCIGIAWSDGLETWSWPGKRAE